MSAAHSTNREGWREVVRKKRQEIDHKIAPYAVPASHLPPDDQTDVSTFLLETATHHPDGIGSLLSRLRDGILSAREVVEGYIKTATVTHLLCVVLTEPNFAAALARADELDAHLAMHGPVGALHGLPITVKDQFNVCGLDTTITYTSLCSQPATSQSGLITVLESLGAIVIAKTTVPQSLMWCETASPLFGLTTNPRNRTFTPGGSSGGEAVLLAMGGSPLGWGTDIGGSIRIPSAMMGIAGFKPSSARLPYAGTAVSTAGQEHVPSSIGPMARTVDALVTAMKAVLEVDLSRVDPRTVPIRWREDRYASVFSRKLRIGLIRDDGVVRVHPPIARALQTAVEKLRATGHELVEWAPEYHAEAIAVMDEFYRADGGEDIRRAVEAGGEPFIPHVEALFNRGPGPLSVFEYWQLNRRKWDVQAKYLAKWNASGSLTSDGHEVDLLLTPVMGHGAVPHGCCKWVGYTKIWNVLDYPAGVFHVDDVRDEDGSEDVMNEWRSYTPRNEMDRWNWQLYDPVAMKGHPVGLQVVGRKLEEEMTLAGMKIIEEALRDIQT